MRLKNDVAAGEDPRPDNEIISQVLSGAPDSYRILVQRYQAMVYGLLFRQINSREVAEELTQETFVRAYLKLSQFRAAAKFSTWLIRIALNQANSFFSSRRFREERLSESLDAGRHQIESEPLCESTRDARRLAAFQQALMRLKPKLREVVVLCPLGEKSYEEASQILGIPVGTVRSRLNSARLKLREAINQAMAGGEA